MVFESLIVFFLLLCWAIFAFNPVVLALTILTLPAAAGHWWMTVLIQDTLGDRVERA
jgi:hypothetical protein